MQRSVIMIATAANKVGVNSKLESLGWGPDNLSRAIRPIGSDEKNFENASHWLGNYAGAPEDHYNQLMSLAAGELSGRLVLDVLYTTWGDISHPLRVDGVLASMGLELIPGPDL